MPKVTTPKSSPVKRQQTAGSSPAKLGSPRKPKKAIQVQDTAQWRASTIPENHDINKSAAIASYHLNANDLQGMPFEKRHTIIKINGKDTIKPMYSWEKHGGPEGFENHLSDKMIKFYAKHGTSSGKLFPKPTTYVLANDPMA
ncbi:hypothetical protein BJ912DRAFT_950963 [Pholiota molesta]|nr:hypothetical protein BJ912DRAFT_950963 [Pholiota molesta]